MNDATPSEISHTRFRRRLLRQSEMRVQQLREQFHAESVANAGGARYADLAIALIFVVALASAAVWLQ